MFLLKKIIKLFLGLFITQPKQKKLLLSEKQIDQGLGPYRSMNKEESEEPNEISFLTKPDPVIIEISDNLLTANEALSIYDKNYDQMKNSAILLWKDKIEPLIKANAKKGIRELYIRENNKTIKKEIEKIAISLGYSVKNCLLPDEFYISF